MSSCFGCVCNFCARNVDIGSQYFTPGEVDELCYNCDDHPGGIGKYKSSCDRLVLSAKYEEHRALMQRMKLKKIGGAEP